MKDVKYLFVISFILLLATCFVYNERSMEKSSIVTFLNSTPSVAVTREGGICYSKIEDLEGLYEASLNSDAKVLTTLSGDVTVPILHLKYKPNVNMVYYSERVNMLTDAELATYNSLIKGYDKYDVLLIISFFSFIGAALLLLLTYMDSRFDKHSGYLKESAFNE